MNNVCVVTVTYGDRGEYLSQVLKACLKEIQVKRIIVVDNASTCNQDFFNHFNTDKIEWVRLKENTGSANGYHIGIKRAYETSKCEFIWLLDDDNAPDSTCLNKLLVKYERFKKENDNEFIAVQARRPQFISHQRLFSMNNPKKFYKNKNSFLDFTLDKLYDKAKFVLKGRKINFEKKYECVEAPYTQYGGLLFPSKFVKQIGYPNSDFYLYVDDTEFTYRITKNGGKIFIIRNAIVMDVDFSWNYTSKNTKKVFFPILEQGTNFRVYYATRNNIYFETQYNISSKFFYKINKCVYIILLFLASVYLNKRKRFKLIMRAIKDANHKKLGKIDENFS